MTFIMFQKGATSWGFQIGKFAWYWPFISFWVCGCRPTLMWQMPDDHIGGNKSWTWHGKNIRKKQ